MADITVRADLCTGAVCAPKGTKRSEIIKAANEQHPTGLDRGWTISKRRKLEDGTKLPAPCLDDPGRRHWLIEC